MLYVEPEQEVGALSVSWGWVHGVQPGSVVDSSCVVEHPEIVAESVALCPCGMLTIVLPTIVPKSVVTSTPSNNLENVTS